MVIEKNTKEVVIRFPFTANMERMQDLVDYLRYKELTANYSTAQSVVDEFSQKINRDWWQKNKSKFEA